MYVLVAVATISRLTLVGRFERTANSVSSGVLPDHSACKLLIRSSSSIQVLAIQTLQFPFLIRGQLPFDLNSIKPHHHQEVRFYSIYTILLLC